MTEIIIALTVLPSIAAFFQPQLMHRFIFHPYQVVVNREYYRFLTSGFLHANWLHLFINMFVLWSFGRWVEQFYQVAFGQMAVPLYLLLYLGAIVASEVPTFLKHRDNPGYASLGASGAVSAIVFASILFKPLEKLYLMGILPIPGILFGVLYLVYSAQMARQSRDNINHDAHFYGAVFGVLFTLLFKPSVAVHFVNELLKFLG